MSTRHDIHSVGLPPAITDAAPEIRAPYLRPNERKQAWTTPDTCRFRRAEKTDSQCKEGFLRHGRQKEWGLNRLAINENSPGGCAGPAGHSSRLTQLSLAGLLLSRAQLCFTEQLYYRHPGIHRKRLLVPAIQNRHKRLPAGNIENRHKRLPGHRIENRHKRLPAQRQKSNPVTLENYAFFE